MTLAFLGGNQFKVTGMPYAHSVAPHRYRFKPLIYNDTLRGLSVVYLETYWMLLVVVENLVLFYPPGHFPLLK